MSIPFDLSELDSKPLTDSTLQRRLKQFTYFPHLVEWLIDPAHDGAVLQKLIENTRAAVQRDRPMGWAEQLARDGSGEGVRGEDRWERTIWRKWRPFEGNMPKTTFHALCPWILSYQVPLFGKQDSEGWGKIDLIGISSENLPVVIEVKAEDSGESPLAVVLEAVRYGIALRELWSRGLRKEWINQLASFKEDELVPKEPLPSQLNRCQLICAAPVKYWERRGPMTTSGQQYRNAWALLRELRAKLDTEHHLPVEFVTLEFSAKTLTC